jgi:Flp pilus assembly pilin Flp
MNTMRFRESFRRFGKNQSGAAGAEFAIVGTLFCVVILVMIQMGVMFYSYNVMQNAARDGVRRLAVDNDMYISVPYDGVDCSSNPTTTTVDGYLSVEAYTCGVLQLFADAKVRACLTDSSGGGPPNSRHDAEVVVTADMAEVGILDLFGVASGFTMTAIAVMRMEDGKIYNPLDSADEPIPIYVCAASVPPITT